MSGLVVAKLGGSHAGSPLLRPWLGAIAGAAGRAVIVPGGGPFADTVRAWQPRLGVDDAAAHAMALLAMAQFGLALAGHGTIFAAVDSLPDILRALAAGRVPVWLPWPALRDAADIAASWDVTSDSLALRLAASLGAASVLLIKRDRSAASGLVDAAFPVYRARFTGAVWIADDADLPPTLDPDNLPGRLWP